MDPFTLIAFATNYFIPFLAVLSILVFVHEWGHYYVARLCGVRVETFSIGFGPALYSLTDKSGTQWKFSAIPLGGYVKMFGDTDPASASHTENVQDGDQVRPMSEKEKSEAFFAKSVWQRSAIVFAGPGINFIFAILLLYGLFLFNGQHVTPPVASSVVVGSAADRAGFEPHDRILEINGKSITRFEDIKRNIAIGLDTPMNFVIDRDGQTIEITASPDRQELEDRFGFFHSRGQLGITGPGKIKWADIHAIEGSPVSSPDEARDYIANNLGKSIIVDIGTSEETRTLFRIEPTAEKNTDLMDEELNVGNGDIEQVIRYNPLTAVIAATRETGYVMSGTLEALGQIITGTRSSKELGGLIRIGAIAGDMAQLGIVALITFTALLSINLGLINLFPIPMLDGGHLVFYAIEIVKGSPLSEIMQEYAMRFGLALLIGLVVFANINDIMQLIL